MSKYLELAEKQIEAGVEVELIKGSLYKHYQYTNTQTEPKDCPECNELDGKDIDCNTCYGKGTIEVIKPLTDAELNEKTEAYLKEQYAVLRRNAYPDVMDLVDAIVKDDTEAVEAYKKACLDVKARFLKT